MSRKLDKPQGPTAAWLLQQIEVFIDLNDLDADGCSFGWLVARDRVIVQRLRDGGDVTTGRMDDILAFIQDPVIKSGMLKPMKITKKELP